MSATFAILTVSNAVNKLNSHVTLVSSGEHTNGLFGTPPHKLPFVILTVPMMLTIMETRIYTRANMLPLLQILSARLAHLPAVLAMILVEELCAQYVFLLPI